MLKIGSPDTANTIRSWIGRQEDQSREVLEERDEAMKKVEWHSGRSEKNAKNQGQQFGKIIVAVEKQLEEYEDRRSNGTGDDGSGPEVVDEVDGSSAVILCE